MRIAHIVSSIDPKAGGVSQALQTMIARLGSEGITNDIVCLDSPAEEFIGKSTVQVYALGPTKTSWRYGPQLIQWLKKHLMNYDSVIIHGLWQYHTFATYKVWKTLPESGRPRYYIMPHGMLDPWFQKAKGRKIKAVRNWLFWKFIESRVVNNANALLFTCETEKILAGTTFVPYHPNGQEIVGLGVEAPPEFAVEMEQAFLEKCKEVKDKAYLLFISRIHYKKGVDLVLKAYLSLKEKGYSLPALVIAGPGGETPYGQQMKSLASADANVFFPGMLVGNAKWGAFYGSEAFILPSHQENFGIAVVEALACGKPVLISNQVNIWREIEAEKAGIIADDTVLAVEKQLLDWVLSSESEKKLIEKNAKSAYQNHFSVEKATHKFKKALAVS